MKIIDEKNIQGLIAVRTRPSDADVSGILAKAALKKGLLLEDVAVLLNTNDPAHVSEIFSVAAKIKNEIYGERLVLFAPLYISDYCANNCLYCNFHRTNETMPRRKLSLDEVAEETKCLIDMGHKRVLIEFGEDQQFNTIDYICETVRTIYSVKSRGNNIRRVNVNIAATTVENYRRLKACGIGTYQLFQETYHRSTYELVHSGPKADYDRQITAHNRAREAGLNDLGIGALFGLYDWRFEVMALVAHAQYMEKNLGFGPHTISIPRFRPAEGINFRPAYPVSDDDFLKLIAILRLAVPYTGMILSTRESPGLRRRAFHIGISQASAASICTPGGYSRGEGAGDAQFTIADNRPIDEVIKSVIEDDLIPSFCTACYRVGRTGEAFMELAKPGDIHNFCRPNALLTFAEYLEDFGNAQLRQKGYQLIKKYLNEISNDKVRALTAKHLAEVKSGRRDIYF